MGAPDLIGRLFAAGLHLTEHGPHNVAVAPREALTDELRTLIREHKPELLAYLRHERMAADAAEKLRQRPELQRAAVIEPDRPGRFIAAVAVRMADGGIATASVANICTDDGLLLLDALDRACVTPVQ